MNYMISMIDRLSWKGSLSVKLGMLGFWLVGMVGVSEFQQVPSIVTLKAGLNPGSDVFSLGPQGAKVELSASPAHTPFYKEVSTGEKRLLDDLNEGSSDQLEMLPGIGPTLAKRIVAYRQEHGKFLHVEEVVRVRGVGHGRLRQIRHHVQIESHGPRGTQASSSKKESE